MIKKTKKQDGEYIIFSVELDEFIVEHYAHISEYYSINFRKETYEDIIWSDLINKIRVYRDKDKRRFK